jgi:hypothetical protein
VPGWTFGRIEKSLAPAVIGTLELVGLNFKHMLARIFKVSLISVK